MLVSSEQSEQMDLLSVVLSCPSPGMSHSPVAHCGDVNNVAPQQNQKPVQTFCTVAAFFKDRSVKCSFSIPAQSHHSLI